jgi:error-prone DNA polymerase
MFMTLEDETGLSNVIVTPDLFKDNRAVLVSAPVLLCEGPLQRQDGTLSAKADRFEPLVELSATAPRDFR